MISIIDPIERIEQVGGGGGGGMTSGVLSLSVNGGPQQVGNVSIAIPTTAGDILAAPVDHNHDDRYYTKSGSQNIFVSKTGNENIDGVKNFTSKPTVNSVPVLLSGEINTGVFATITYVNNVSGDLASRISSSTAGVSSINSKTGNLLISGVGSISVVSLNDNVLGISGNLIGGSGVSDGDKGDIVVSSNGSVWTIDAGVVSTSKLGGDVTNAGKSLLTGANAADQRNTLGLGDIATESASNFSRVGHTHNISDVSGLQNLLNSKVSISGDTMSGKLIAAADTNSSKLNIGAPIANASPVSYAAGDTWINNQNKFTWATSPTAFGNAAAVNQTNTFNQPQTISATNVLPTLTVANTCTGSALIVTASGGGTLPAVKITQFGNGDALVVEDQASDTTTFRINSNGKVGVGVNPDSIAAISVDAGGIRFNDGTYQTTAIISSGSSNVVFTTGDQTISGVKSFATRPNVNGVPVLLSGEGSGSGAISDGDKGDITVASNGSVWSVNTGVIDTSKLGGNITTAGKNLLDDANAEEQRSTLGLGDLATGYAVNFAKANHDHLISQVSGLQEALDAKQNSGEYYLNSNPSGYIGSTNVVFTTGNQSIGGTKSFTSRPDVNGIPVLLSGEGGGSGITNLTNVVYTTGNQTVSGIKDFTLRPKVTGTQVVIETDFTYERLDTLGIVLTTGNQRISGIKDFDLRPTVDGVAVLLSGEGFSGIATGNFITTSQTGAFYAASNPSGFITSANLNLVNVVYTTGNQTVSGTKSFVTRPRVTGVQVVIENDFTYQSLDTLGIVFTTGNQTISGSKSFVVRPTVNGTPVLLSGEGGVGGGSYTIAQTDALLSGKSNTAHFHLASDITGGTLNNTRTTATSSNTTGTIVARDSNGNFTAGRITSSLTVPRTSSIIFNDSLGSDYIITGGVDDKLFLQAGGVNILEIDNTAGYPIWKFKDSIAGSLAKIGVFTDNPATELHVNGVITADRIAAAVATTSQSGLMSATDKVLLNSAVFATGDQIVSGVKTFASRPTVNGTPILLSGEVSGGGSTGSSVSRGTASVTTTSIAASGTFNTAVDFGCKSYGLLSVSGASGAWVKLYYDTTSRTNDATRTIDQDPASNVSLMAESLSTGNGLIRFAPATIGYNEGTGNLVPIAITNTRATAATYTVAFNFLKLET